MMSPEKVYQQLPRRPSFKTHPLNKKRYYSTNGRKTIPVVLKKLPKDKAITNFEILLDESNDGSILAGSNMNGKVRFDVRRPMSIWYVELLIEGCGITYIHRGAYGTQELEKEVYLQKQTLIMGSGKTNRVVHLEPGTYNTEFSYNLPENLPASLLYVNTKTRYGISIEYEIRVRICDDMGVVKMDLNKQQKKHLVKVIQSKRMPFMVHRLFNLYKHPLAYTCLSHNETLNTSCLSPEKPAQVSLNTDRSVYQVGDKVELHIEVTTKSNHYQDNHVNWVKLELVQNAALRYKDDHQKIKEKKFTTVISSFQKRIKLGGEMNDYNTNSECDIFFPIPRRLISSINTACNLIEIRYTLRVTIHFSNFGGRLLAQFPIIIGPAGNGYSGDRKDSIPIFNKPALMFPKFSLPSTNLTWRGSVASNASMAKNTSVNTKYYNWLDSLFLTNE